MLLFSISLKAQKSCLWHPSACVCNCYLIPCVATLSREVLLFRRTKGGSSYSRYDSFQPRDIDMSTDTGNLQAYPQSSSKCINVVYRAKSARASSFVPYECMCPISLDWYRDPVVTFDGQSSSKQELLDSLQNSPINPVSGGPLQVGEWYPNVALAAAVEYFRLNLSAVC